MWRCRFLSTVILIVHKNTMFSANNWKRRWQRVRWVLTIRQSMNWYLKVSSKFFNDLQGKGYNPIKRHRSKASIISKDEPRVRLLRGLHRFKKRFPSFLKEGPFVQVQPLLCHFLLVNKQKQKRQKITQLSKDLWRNASWSWSTQVKRAKLHILISWNWIKTGCNTKLIKKIFQMYQLRSWFLQVKGNQGIK